MDIWETDKFIIFLLFVIPGFISLKTYELLIPSTEKSSSKQIIDAIAYSCINYAILLVPIVSIESSKLNTTSPIYYYLFYLFVFFLAPILWVGIWKGIRLTRTFQSIAPHPTINTWDYIFSQRKEYWIIITLKNCSKVGGKYSVKSFSSSSPAREQIYLEESWVINKKGGFDNMKNKTDGIMIMQNQISHIEFVKYQY